jgi:hypothetical protein
MQQEHRVSGDNIIILYITPHYSTISYNIVTLNRGNTFFIFNLQMEKKKIFIYLVIFKRDEFHLEIIRN